MSATVTDQQAAGDANDRATSSRDVQVTRWVATIAGLIGFVLSIATPLLPVVQTTAMLNWPQNGQLNSVTAPLISLTPVDMLATVPCSVVRNLPPGGGVILGTGPKKGKDADLNALFVVVSRQRVDVTDRNVVIVSVPREQAMSAQCQRHRDHLDARRHLRHLRGVERSVGQTGPRWFPRPEPTPAGRRRVHRSDRSRTARFAAVGDH